MEDSSGRSSVYICEGVSKIWVSIRPKREVLGINHEGGYNFDHHQRWSLVLTLVEDFLGQELLHEN